MSDEEEDTGSDSGFDWSEEHKAYWTNLAGEVGATLMQARMAYALAMGMSQAASARFSGYKGIARTAGFHAARSNKVATLLTIAEGDGWKSPDAFVSEEEKDKLLSQLMRSGDPTARLRALEQSDKRRERELERDRQDALEARDRGDPIKLLNELGETMPLVAQLLARNDGLAWKMPPMSRSSALAQIEDMRKLVFEMTDTPERTRTDGNEAEPRHGRERCRNERL